MADTIRFQRIIEEHYTNLVNKLDIYTETKLSQNNGLSEEIKTNLNNSRQKILDKINTVKSANLANLQETNFKSRIESLKFKLIKKSIYSIIFSNGYLFEDEFVLENNTKVPCFINWYHFLDGDRFNIFSENVRMYSEHINDWCLLENVFSKQKDLETDIFYLDFTDESFLNEIHSLKFDSPFFRLSKVLDLKYFKEKLGLKNLNSLNFVNIRFENGFEWEQLMNITELIFENCDFDEILDPYYFKSLTFNRCKGKDMMFIKSLRNISNLKITNPKFNDFLESKSMKNEKIEKFFDFNDLFQLSNDLKELVMTRCYLFRINEFDFRGLNNLIELRLSNNFIEHIDDYSFKELNLLKKLFLDKNAILRITRNTFKGLNQLIFIDISNNPLVFIDDEAFSDSNEVYIHR